VRHHDVNSWFSSGGEETLNSYARKPSNLRYDPVLGIYDPLLEAHVRWLDTLPRIRRASQRSIALVLLFHKETSVLLFLHRLWRRWRMDGVSGTRRAGRRRELDIFDFRRCLEVGRTIQRYFVN
jgi:hypothetical protein